MLLMETCRGGGCWGENAASGYPFLGRFVVIVYVVVVVVVVAVVVRCRPPTRIWKPAKLLLLLWLLWLLLA